MVTEWEISYQELQITENALRQLLKVVKTILVFSKHVLNLLAADILCPE